MPAFLHACFFTRLLLYTPAFYTPAFLFRQGKKKSLNRVKTRATWEYKGQRGFEGFSLFQPFTTKCYLIISCFCFCSFLSFVCSSFISLTSISTNFFSVRFMDSFSYTRHYIQIVCHTVLLQGTTKGLEDWGTREIVLISFTILATCSIHSKCLIFFWLSVCFIHVCECIRRKCPTNPDCTRKKCPTNPGCTRRKYPTNPYIYYICVAGG